MAEKLNEKGVWHELDYSHNALIEASAGTGKTYALENIVKTLICDKGYEAKSILLVTFTEKAAGELKNRVREALVKADKLPVDFDEMTICTIHSFCQRLLSEYAFENGVPMRCEVGGDSAALARRAVLEALKNRDFASKYPDGIYGEMNQCGIKSIEELISIVTKYVHNGGVEKISEMKRCAEENLYAQINAAKAEIIDAYGSLVKFSNGNIAKYILEQAGFKKDEHRLWYKWLEKNFNSLSSPNEESIWESVNKESIGDKIGINPKIKKWCGNLTKEGRKEKSLFDIAEINNYYDAMEKMYAAVKQLHKEMEKIKDGSNKDIRKNKRLISLTNLVYGLVDFSSNRFQKLKQDAALMTFDDLVVRAAEVVCKNPETEEEKTAKANLFKSIRSRYRVALVDEFQDTDQKQWDIFRTLFSAENNKVEGSKPGFLLVVGDPKQAIYSFRGADVGVYCSARETLTENNTRKTLDETYRSTRKLIDAFNIFFGKHWFENSGAGEGIEYAGVNYPHGGNKKFDNITADKELKPILLIESMSERVMPSAYNGKEYFGNKSKCLPVFMENAAKEMKRLKALNGANGDETNPQFNYGDMCVLVEGKTDAAVVRRALERHGIPYGQHKQQGLYDSSEAEGVLALFDYLSNPSARGNRTALLMSPIFNVHPSQIGKRSQTDENAFDKFIERIRGCAREKDWNRFFELVMSDDCTSLMNPGTDLCAFNRTRAATRQIFDDLLTKCGSLADTVEDFASVLREWRKNDKTAGENGALYKKESNADRVQIMTMHASKGLQFPIVFLAYGFANQVKNGTPDEEKPSARQERRRLLYVALTRAEYRLYLPWSKRAWEWEMTVNENKKDEKGKVIKDESGKNVTVAKVVKCSGLGSCGSVLLASSEDGFLGRAILSYFTSERERSNAFAPEYNVQALSADVNVAPKSSTEQTEAQTLSTDIQIPGLKSRRVQWDSFSLMQKHSSVAVQKITPESDASHKDENDNNPPPTTETLLKRGNVSGNVFHEIMETLCNNDNKRGEVDFETACEDGMAEEDSLLRMLIRQVMRKNMLSNHEKGADSTEKTLLRMVQNALNTEITIGGISFKLKDVPRQNRMAEVEFVADENKLLNLSVRREGSLNGKIDLLVRVGDKVVILDWKTNSLSDYTDSNVIKTAMDEADYHLQYQLYSLAVHAWLKSYGLTLCGAAYLFVRGGEFGTDRSGLFVTKIDAQGVERFRTDISAKGIFAAGKEAE